MIYEIIKILVAIMLTLGGIDYLLGNRFHLGEHFEKGFHAAGGLFLCMTGFICLAPIIGDFLVPIVGPFFNQFGIDPSLIAGLIFANDSGATSLALSMTSDLDMAYFSGLMVGNSIGTTVMFNISIATLYTRPEQRRYAFAGILVGIITAPVGILVSGLLAGFPINKVLLNLVPVILASLFLSLMLAFRQELAIRLLGILGKIILSLNVCGIILASLSSLLGITLLPGMADISEVFLIVGGICVFLTGIFPLLHLMQKGLQAPLSKISKTIGINATSISGFLASFANGLASAVLFKEMDSLGLMLVCAFLVSGSCIFGDHLAYTAQINSLYCVPVLAGKATGGILAVALAYLLRHKLTQ